MSNTTKKPIANHNDTQTPIGYKRTAIGVIPIDWDVKKLSDCANILMGQSPSSTSYNGNGDGFYLIQGNADIKDRLSSPRIWTNDPTKLCKEGDILMSVRAPVGTISKSKHTACIGRGICSIKSKEKINQEFLYNFLLSFESQWKSLEQGSTFTAVNSNDIMNLQLPIPSIAEQQKIAEILSTWDEAISNCKNTINTLKLRNKGLSQQLLTGKKRLSGFSEKWEIKKIKDFSLEISSKNKGDEDLIVLSCTKYNGLVPSLEYFGRKIYSDNLKTYKIVKKNTFAYATNHIEEGSIGYQNKYESALISPMYTVFKTDENINDDFLFKVLKSNTYIQEYQKRMEGSIDRRGGLRWQEFSKIKVSVPSYEEQTAIALALETADQELKSYETKLEALQLQKKGLMQQLLTGKIRVNVK